MRKQQNRIPVYTYSKPMVTILPLFSFILPLTLLLMHFYKNKPCASSDRAASTMEFCHFVLPDTTFNAFNITATITSTASSRSVHVDFSVHFGHSFDDVLIPRFRLCLSQFPELRSTRFYVHVFVLEQLHVPISVCLCLIAFPLCLCSPFSRCSFSYTATPSSLSHAVVSDQRWPDRPADDNANDSTRITVRLKC